MPVSVVSCSFHPFVLLPCTYCEPLAIIGLATGEEGAERVVGWDGKAGSVDQELAGNVKEDEEEVQGAEAKCDVDLGDAGLLLEVVEDGVFAELVGPSVCARYTCIPDLSASVGWQKNVPPCRARRDGTGRCEGYQRGAQQS